MSLVLGHGTCGGGAYEKSRYFFIAKVDFLATTGKQESLKLLE
jgi:hypothetical protein